MAGVNLAGMDIAGMNLTGMSPGGDGYVWNGDSRKEFWRSTDWLEKAVDRMSRYVLFATGPDHVQIAQCDSDVTDVRDVMVKAAVLTGDGRYKYAGYDTVDLDSAWLLKCRNRRIPRYGRQNAGEPVPGSSGCRAYFFQKQLGGGQPFYLPEMRSPWKRARTCGSDPYIALLQRPFRTGGQRQVLLCGGRTAAPVSKERPGPQCMRYRRRVPWKAQGFMGV